jgi:hypothetical protein
MFMLETAEREVGVQAEAQATEKRPGANGAAGTRKPRGKGIIYFGLREADEAIRKIDPQAKRMSRQGFAVALGHKKPENRFAQKLEALRTFTLLEDDGDDVKLTSLATDMLYAGSESARNQARAKAFLAYPDFQRTFIECPKNQEHPLSYVKDFITGKLGIINEAPRFIKLFLESAQFANLLEGEADSKAERIKLRPSALGEVKGAGESARPSGKPADVLLPGEEAKALLNEHGLLEFSERIEVYRSKSGRVKTTTEGGKLTIELHLPLKMVLQSENLIEDLVRVLNILKERGFQA